MKNKYFLTKLSSSPKLLFFGVSVLCYLIAAAVFIVNPEDPGVSLNFGGYTQGEVSLFSLSVGTLLVPLYYILARMFKSDYVAGTDKKSSGDEWLK